MKTFIPYQFRPFVFFLLIANVSGRAQVRRTREKYFTAGFNAGILGGSAIVDNCLEGSRFNHAMGFVVSNNGRNQPILVANTSLGINAGFLWKDKDSKNY